MHVLPHFYVLWMDDEVNYHVQDYCELKAENTLASSSPPK